MPTTELAQILHRRDTAANWLLADPIMGAGEVGYETDTKLSKIGDGTSLWSALTYQGPQLAAQINLASAKTTPVDADTFPLSDSAASNGLKKVSWTNILATFEAYYDSVAATLTNKTLTSPVVTGLYLGDASIVFEGAVADAFETTVTAAEPTADRTITFPNLDGMVALTDGYTTTPTAAGTTVLTVASTKRQVFTGTLAQIVTMPVVSTLPELGYPYRIINDSTGIVTVNSSGGNLIYAIPTGVTVEFICTLITGTTAASWLADYPAAAAAAPFVGCSVYNSAAQNLTLNTHTIATYDSENYDTDAFHSTSSNTSRLTIPSGKDGKYRVTVMARVSGQSYFNVYLYKNGVAVALGTESGIVAGWLGSAANIQIVAAFDISLVATDYIEIDFYGDKATGNNLLKIVTSLQYLGA